MITVSAVHQFRNRAVLTVLKHLWDVGRSLPFDSSYLTEDAYGNIFLYPGMIVSFKDETRAEYVPYNSSASYGSYSAYPVGVLYTLYDCTQMRQVVAPATRAAVVEQNCYVFGGTMGVISDVIKQAIGMKLIQWD